MICSILVPTRARPELAIALIENISNTITDISRVELLFRVDTDDIPTQHALQLAIMNSPLHIKMLVGPRPPRMYQDIFMMYNDLAKIAIGQYMWIFNDDAKMDTIGWDDTIAQYTTQKIVHIAIPGHIGNLFPLVHRSIPDMLGHLGTHMKIDVQYQNLAATIPELAYRESNISVTHFGHPVRPDGPVSDPDIMTDLYIDKLRILCGS